MTENYRTPVICQVHNPAKSRPKSESNALLTTATARAGPESCVVVNDAGTATATATCRFSALTYALRHPQKLIMPVLTMEAARYSARGVSDEVTRQEIAQTERILNLIDVNNAVLSNLSKWLLIWDGVRDLSNRYAKSTRETQESVAADFCGLLKDVERIGCKLVSLSSELNIEPEQLVLATSCDISSIQACLSFLGDKITQWFGDPVGDETVNKVWRGIPNEPVPVV